MAACYEMARQKLKGLCLERERLPGGLSRTLRYGQFSTDIGPHRFFSKNRHLYVLIESLLGDRWKRVDRQTRFYIDGEFFSYPVQPLEALRKVGMRRGMRMAYDYFFERIRRILRRRPARSVEEDLVSAFGRSLAELNMLNYTEKVWGVPPSELSPDWTKQRIKDLSMTALLKTIVFPKTREGDRPKTLVDQFHYPDGGAGVLYETMRKACQECVNVAINSYPVRIHHDGSRILDVTCCVDGKKRSVSVEYVISSIPITDFVRLLDPPPPDRVLSSCEKLRFRSHVSLFLTLRRETVFPDQWIYVPEREIPFGRITEPKNFSSLMAPPGKTSLLVEFFCWEGDEIWRASVEQLGQLAVNWLEREGFIDPEDVMDTYVHRERHAYPVYLIGYDRHLHLVKSFLDQFENLQLIGRSGLFRYNNQDHAIHMGLLAARAVSHGRLLRRAVEAVGTEQEYLERGTAV